jgi:hypothetical protein
LVGELESSLRHIRHWLQRIERTARTDRLSWRHHPHVDILLMRSLNLLLLLLQQLDLLLNGKLLH